MGYGCSCLAKAATGLLHGCCILAALFLGHVQRCWCLRFFPFLCNSLLFL
ncbi:hypothetical protein Pint_08104 [Pistacia integerrima]|uniref:Uncharacterized protein n=1 Tax=Pistacia integerrima TaxID=434235 RepID=A0ACC0XVN6_9ROSI|nr:hypothetical protein Pint_08104 [Pistacia integerrima]